MEYPYLLSISPTADREAFIQYMVENGVPFAPVDGMPRYFHVSEGFNHPDILTFDLADVTVKPTAHLPLTISTDLEGGWNLARVIRRNKPYNPYRMEGVGVETFFEAARTGDGVDVYVCDSGIITSLAEFSGRATAVYDYYSEGGVDGHGHGTRMSALACGVNVGIAHDALIWSFRSLDNSGGGTLTSIVACLGQILTHYNGRSDTNRPAVLNLSLSIASTGLNAAIADLIDAGVVVVAAAGNDASDLDGITQYPAKTTGVVTVGGTNANDGPYYSGASGTNYNTTYVDVLAPAQITMSRGIADDIQHVSGTSSACAIVSGVLACMLEGHSRLADAIEVAAVKATLLANATTGRFTEGPGIPSGGLPDKIVYLDPSVAIEDILGT